ncbi:integrase [Novosphingobium taihuense]|uniref:Integrase n=1 Tax=Novosphingobium taihuense TaxID=260085 RepID=A0A7W7EVD1_9SPHN|nr:integrase [Novosphingobium taihuense]TWH84367.1 integrase [Novosphingobium taihuense]
MADEIPPPGGTEKKLAFGAYPEVSLKAARDLRNDARKLLASGTDPVETKKQDRHAAKVSAANSCVVVAQSYIDKCKREVRSERTTDKQQWLLKLLDRTIGQRPVAEIQPFEMLEAVRKYETTGRTEAAHRALQFASQVFRFAIANQLAPSDPTRDLRGALTSHKSKHHAAILEPKKAGELLRAIDGYDGHPVTRFVLQLAALVFVRPGELRYAEWSEFDFDAKVWRIPAEKMKARSEHVVPLSRQALAVLAEARALTGDGQYVFPSIRTHLRPMSENTVYAALRRLGYSNDEMTGHGFRAMASTLLNESSKWSSDAIERALAHKDKDAVRAAYHRGQHWQERVDMAQ